MYLSYRNNTFIIIKMKHLLLLFLMLLFKTDIICGQIVFPTPEQINISEGYFEWKEKSVSVYASDKVKKNILLFSNYFVGQKTLKWCKNRVKAEMRFIEDSICPSEGYRLHITPKFIEISASDKGGFIYAIQTLYQWEGIGEEKGNFRCVSITDSPRMVWRSFMLDSGRQYQQVSTIKKYIDMASLLKMNRFHWHLTEGLGWRIEIKQYPFLTQKGAFVGKREEQQGYYTQEEIREIVRYASERNITVVPEIDMPGHAEAALSAYPELGCFSLPVEVPQIGFTQHIFCAGKEHTIQFLRNVLDEVCTLFPSTYIHLGGDEAPKGNWSKCKDCQKKILDMKLRDNHDLQLWFSSEMAKYLEQKGRKAIFWGDVVYKEGYLLPDNVIIQWWNFRGHKDLALKNAVRRGHPAICSTNNYTYLNFPLTPWRGYKEDRTFDLRDVYLNNPSYIASKEDEPLILGIGCALWTDDGVREYMIDQRLFPRILALSEQMWHKGNLVDFQDFYDRILQKKDWFQTLGYHFGPALKGEVNTEYKWD